MKHIETQNVVFTRSADSCELMIFFLNLIADKITAYTDYVYNLDKMTAYVTHKKRLDATGILCNY